MMKNFLKFLACASLLIGFAACSDDDKDDSTPPQPSTLDKPVLNVASKDASSFIVNWTAVANATGYVYTVDNEAEQKTTATQIVRQGLTAETAYTVKVKATATGYTDSDWATITVTTDGQSTAEGVTEGNYILSVQVGENEYEDNIIVVAKDGNGYTVDNLFWYPVPLTATYDASAGTLILDGMGTVTFQTGPELVQFFGQFYYTSEDGSYAFSLWSFTDINDDSEDGSAPCVIKINPTTGELSELTTYLREVIGNVEGQSITGIAGVDMVADPGATFTKTNESPTALSVKKSTKRVARFN